MNTESYSSREDELKKFQDHYEKILHERPTLTFGSSNFGTSPHVPLEIFYAISAGALMVDALADYHGHLKACVQCQQSRELYVPITTRPAAVVSRVARSVKPLIYIQALTEMPLAISKRIRYYSTSFSGIVAITAAVLAVAMTIGFLHLNRKAASVVTLKQPASGFILLGKKLVDIPPGIAYRLEPQTQRLLPWKQLTRAEGQIKSVDTDGTRIVIQDKDGRQLGLTLSPEMTEVKGVRYPQHLEIGQELNAVYFGDTKEAVRLEVKENHKKKRN